MRLALVVFLSHWAVAATAQSVQRLQVGLGVMGLLYTGDLTTHLETYHRVYPGGVFSLQFESPRLVSPSISMGFGRVRAQDRLLGPTDGVQPNTFVATSCFFADLMVRMRPLRRRNFRPHGALGLGVINFSPRDAAGLELINQQNTRARGETYNTTTFFFPLALGFQVRLNALASIGVEYKRLLIFTDYFDNISRLGPRAGNDRLNSLSVGLFLTPGTRLRAGRGGR